MCRHRSWLEVTEVAGRNRPTTPIYLDYQATTPTDPRVVDAMLPYFTLKFGNPHSRNHQYGWESEEAVEKAREQIGAIIGADPREIIFTSGATESNNLALKGVMRFHKDKKNHLITCVTEHKCVLDSARHLEMEGVEVTYLPVQPNGLIDLAVLEAAITPKTALVSIMAANNEIGVVQPLGGDRRALPFQGRLFPHRRGPGRRQDPDGCRGDEDRPHEHLRPQDLRAQGHRRSLCPAQAARAAGGDDPRRRAGARHALGHAADAALRRPRRGLRHRASGDAGGSQAPGGAARPAASRDHRAAAGGLSERRSRPIACRAISTSASPMSRARG